jgi:hypothetical protein
VIITNDDDTATKQLIERYARRMTIEQRLAEAIRSFHLDALSSAVPLNVDLDVALSVLAGAVCAVLRRGYHRSLPVVRKYNATPTGACFCSGHVPISVYSRAGGWRGPRLGRWPGPPLSRCSSRWPRGRSAGGPDFF